MLSNDEIDVFVERAITDFTTDKQLPIGQAIAVAIGCALEANAKKNGMSFNEYQAIVVKNAGTSLQEPWRDQMSLAGLGLAGEAGECADTIKKILHHGRDLELLKPKLIEEAGDTLWYVALICQVIGISLEDLARANNKKLADRYPTGFSHAAVAARVAEKEPAGSVTVPEWAGMNDFGGSDYDFGGSDF